MVLEEAGDYGADQRSLTHISDRVIIDRVVTMTGAQQFEEIEAALGFRGAEPGEVLVADLCAEAVAGPCGGRQCRQR